MIVVEKTELKETCKRYEEAPDMLFQDNVGLMVRFVELSRGARRIGFAGIVISTLTTQIAILLPSTVVTVIFAVPEETEVTTPVELTVATPGSEELQVTFLLVALAGTTVATTVPVDPPAFKFIVVG